MTWTILAKRSALVVLALLLSAGTSSAFTYYVAQSGGRSRSCLTARTLGTPKATVNAGLACLSAGDTLLIRAGTYNENITDNIASGTSWSNKVRIANYNGEVVRLAPTGAEDVIDFQTGGPGHTYVEFDGLILDGTGTTSVTICLCNGDDFIRIQNSEIIGSPNAGNCASICGGNFGNEYLHNIIHGGGIGGGCGTACANAGIYTGGNNNLIDGNEIYDTSQTGIQIYSSQGAIPGGNIIRNNRVHDMVRSGYGNPGAPTAGILIAGGANNQVYNNLIYDNGIPDGGDSNAGINLYSGGTTQTKIWNNTIVGNYHNGIWIDSNVSDTVVQNNIAYGHGGYNFKDNGINTNGFSTGVTGDPENMFDGTDPLFTNPAAHDYTLQAGSPALNVGVTIATVTTDLLGVLRPQATWYDIGAYERTAASAPVITTATLPNAVLTVAYSRSLAATGGSPPYTWAVSAGALPINLALSAGGTITGTPTVAASYTFTVRVTDNVAATSTFAYTVIVRAATSITTTSPLASGILATPYTATLVGAGDEAPYVWTLASGTLPTGLTLSTGGVISGTPASSAPTTATVRLTGALGSTITKALSLTIAATEYRPTDRPIARNQNEGVIFRRLTAPTNPTDKVMRGDLWIDLSVFPPLMKICTSATATTAVWSPVP